MMLNNETMKSFFQANVESSDSSFLQGSCMPYNAFPFVA